MKSRVKILTNEQREHWNNILKKKSKVMVAAEIQKQPTTRKEYMDNCVYWMHQYVLGRVDIHKAKKAVFYFNQYCDQIIIELLVTADKQTKNTEP